MKRGGDPLDLSMLSLCLAEIGFLRVVLLSALHRLAPQRVTHGLGQPMPLPTQVAAGFDTVSEFTIKSEADAVRYVSQETDARCGQETRR